MTQENPDHAKHNARMKRLKVARDKIQGTQNYRTRIAGYPYWQWQGQILFRIWHGNPQYRMGDESWHIAICEGELGNG